MEIATKYTKANLTLDGFVVEDLWARTKQWPNIIGTIQSEAAQSHAIEIKFESNKDFIACPFHVDFNVLHPLLVVANIPLIIEVTRTMTVALQNEKLDFEYFIQLALSHIKDLRAKTVNIADSIKKGEYEHSNVSINAKIKAPILILPSDLYDKDSF